ncbi:hypothetical protein TWF132_006355 [Orbilia oligospora]|nr:hypothetical protein TWF132_006355 [Orbilia oligospora]
MVSRPNQHRCEHLKLKNMHLFEYNKVNTSRTATYRGNRGPRGVCEDASFLKIISLCEIYISACMVTTEMGSLRPKCGAMWEAFVSPSLGFSTFSIRKLIRLYRYSLGGPMDANVFFRNRLEKAGFLLKSNIWGSWDLACTSIKNMTEESTYSWGGEAGFIHLSSKLS